MAQSTLWLMQESGVDGGVPVLRAAGCVLVSPCVLVLFPLFTSSHSPHKQTHTKNHRNGRPRRRRRDWQG